jgi:hypothetical protein
VIVTIAGLTVKTSVAVPVPVTLVAPIVTLKMPAAEGVPLMIPV